jgi:large conductance mechanosensitive channel
MSILNEFMDFLKEYKVISLAIAFIIAVAASALVTALVNDIIMPIVGVLIPGGEWRTATFDVGPVKFAIGDFVGQLINFIIIAFVVFMLSKMVLREDKVSKK